MFRFRDRAAILDEPSLRFLTTIAWLGGYVTAEQAQKFGIKNSAPRVHVHLNNLEAWGFIKRVATYPAVFQVTKSVTRLIGADLSARRQHAIETIHTKLLTVNFYLEAVRWPAEFVFDHQQKIAKFRSFGCEADLLPQRSGKPYLWQDLLLVRPSGDLVVALVDHFGRSPYLRVYRLLQRFAPSLRLIQNEMKLVVAVGSDHRLRLFSRLLKRPRLQRLLAEVTNGLARSVKLYRAQRPVPSVRLAVPRGQDRQEFRLAQLAKEGRNDARSGPSQAVHSDATYADDDLWIENGGESC